MLRGWEKVFGGGRWATLAGILLSAVLYGVYHFASVDEITSLQGMLDEIMITTLIGIGFGVFVVLSRSMVAAFVINWVLNLFVFSPLETFHPPVWQWPLGVIVLLVLWLVYRYRWLE
jgi:membrane protease YdiL (CAAX protease family)